MVYVVNHLNNNLLKLIQLTEEEVGWRHLAGPYDRNLCVDFDTVCGFQPSPVEDILRRAENHRL